MAGRFLYADDGNLHVYDLNGDWTIALTTDAVANTISTLFGSG